MTAYRCSFLLDQEAVAAATTGLTVLRFL